MKILAVRGHNLASLADEFEIAFDSGPLAEAGLIAIAGPTGAGKTTILDTMCLALFHRLPRQDGYTNQSSVGRGGETLTATDPRNLMRKGASQCFAEVDFLGGDGKRYRARWAARRGSRGARSLQPPKVELSCLDSDEVIAGTLTEVQRSLPSVLGLTFDQFRRSVLLAQGDFAAFLRTSPTERAALLESITGTSVYSTVGRLAHLRAKEVNSAIHDFQLQRNTIKQLPAEKRMEIDGRLESLEAELSSANQRFDDLRVEHNWHVNRGKLTERLVQARLRLESAEKARRDEDETSELLALVQRAEELRSAYDLRSSRLQELQDASEAVSECNGRVVDAKTELKEAEELETEAKERRDEFEADYELAGKDLDAAQKLDTLIDEGRGALAKLVKEREARLADLAGVKGELKQKEKELAEHKKAIEVSTTWLTDNARAVLLEKDWSLVSDKLGDIGSALENAPDVQARVLASVPKGQHLEFSDVVSLQTDSHAVVTELTTEWATAEKTCKQLDLTSVEATLKECRNRREVLLGLKTQAESILKTTVAEALERTNASTGRDAAASAEGAVKTLESRIASTRTKLEEASLAEATHEKILSLEEHRSRLVDGEPCPLCGSEHHPFATDLPPAENPFAKRVADLKVEVESLDNERLGKARALSAASSSADEATSRADGHARELRKLLTKWQASDGQDAITARPTDDTVIDQISAALTSIDSAVERQEATKKAAEEALAERDRIRDELADQRATLDCVNKLVESMGRIRPFVEHIESWTNAIVTEPAAFVALCEDLVAECRDAASSKTAADTASNALAPVVSALESRADSMQEAIGRLNAGVEHQESTVQEHERQRGELLGGATVVAFRAEMEQAKRSRREEFETATSSLTEAREKMATERTKLEGLLNVRSKAEAASDLAAQAFRELLTERKLSEHDLIERLSYGPGWIDQTLEKLSVLDQGVRDANQEVNTRAQDLKRHEEELAPLYDAATCAEELRLLEETRDTKVTEQASLKQHMQADDEAAQERASLQKRIDDVKVEGWVWLQLDDLVGCAQGARLRNMVQGLTFEVLLSLANKRLRELRPQYSLERVPVRAGRARDEMELQIVDHFAADEVRPVSSLSGGETFLVSIALALALSSISSQNTRIDSLFVDEGFGTLDAETLNTAMSTLEQLSAGEKQVTIISHVEGLRERVDACIDVIQCGPGRSVLSVSSGQSSVA